MLMPTITICTFLTLTNGFKLFDQNFALTGVTEAANRDVISKLDPKICIHVSATPPPELFRGLFVPIDGLTF